MTTDYEKERVKSMTPLSYFTNHLSLSAAFHNLEPLILRRTTDEFVSFCALNVVPKTDVNYKRLLVMLFSLAKKEKKGAGCVIDLLQPNDFRPDPHSFYILDLRSDPEKMLDPITFKNIDKVLPFVFNQICMNLLNSVRGLYVFADKYSDIPKCLYGRAQFGLSSETGLDLHHFVHKGACTTFYSQPKKEDDKLYGFSNCEIWPAKVYF